MCDGSRGWVLLDEAAEQGLGRALTWASQRSLRETHLLAEGGAGVLARRAALFREPPVVWRIDGNELERAVPEPPAAVTEPAVAALDLVHHLTDAGLDIVIEQGIVRGEVLGLEVARIEVDDRGAARIEVGVGRHDRDAFALVHGELPPAEALASVAESVRQHRRPGAVGHPFGRLVPERWMRATVMAEPGLIGAVSLEPVEPTVGRESVKETAPALAVGRDPDGAPLLAAFSVGIDLDLVPAAADARAAHAPLAELLLVVPTRDDHPVTHALADALREPARVVAFAGDFRTAARG